MTTLRQATVIAIFAIGCCVSFTFLPPTLYVILVLITAALYYIFWYRVNHATTRRYLERMCRGLRVPTNIQHWILNNILDTDRPTFCIASQDYNPPVPRLPNTTIHSPSTSMNISLSMIESEQPVANPMVLNTRGVEEKGSLSTPSSHLHSASQSSRSLSSLSSRKFENSFAAPRDRPVGVKTCHAVAGPTLASTRFKQNLDYCVHADINSPGFSDRIASYHQEANSEIPSSSYTTPGQFPSVKLVKDNMRVVSMKNRPKPYIPVTVRIAPPVREYTSSTRFERPREEKMETPTQSVLDALKEISRKRIHGEVSAEDTEVTKKYKNDGLDLAYCPMDDVRSGGGETSSNKRVRSNSASSFPVAKRPCSNEIDSSLSSTLRVKYMKRNASAAAIRSPSPGPSIKKKLALSIADIEYDFSEKIPTSDKNDVSSSSHQEEEKNKTQDISRDENPLTPVAESTEPLRPLFGKPTSPKIDTSLKNKGSPVFATMQTEETSAAELSSRHLRQKKLKSLFNAIKRDEQMGSTLLDTSVVTTKEQDKGFPAVSLISSTTLTAAITTPVVSTAQQGSLTKFGIGSSNSSLQKSNPLTPASSFASQIQSVLPTNTINADSGTKISTDRNDDKILSNNEPPKEHVVNDNLILEQPKGSCEASNLGNTSTVQTVVASGASQVSTPVIPSAPPNQLLSLQKSQTLGAVNPSPTFSLATTSASPSSSASDVITNFGSSSSNFMTNLIPSSQSVKTSTAFSQAKPSSEVFTAAVTTSTATAPKFGNLSFGNSPALSTFASPSTDLNNPASKPNAPPSYSVIPSAPSSSAPVFGANMSPFVSGNMTPTVCTNSTTTSNALPSFGMSNSTLSTFGNSSSPFATNSNVAPPPAYSTTPVSSTANNVQPAFGNANLSFTSNNEVSNFGAPNKAVNSTLTLPQFGSSNSPFALTGAPPAYGTSNVSATSPTAPTVDSTNASSSTLFNSTKNPKPTGFGSETFSFCGQKQADTANAFSSPGFGSLTTANTPQFPQAPNPSSNNFGFSSTPTTSSNTFSMTLPTTTASSGLFQFGQTASNTSAPFGQTATNVPSAFGQSPLNTNAPFFQSAANTPQFGQNTSSATAPFGQATALSTASPFGQAATNMSSHFGQTASNTTTQFGQTVSSPSAPFGQNISNASSPFGQSSANTASKPLFGGFSFGEAQSTQATEPAVSDFGASNTKPLFPNIFGAPPNQSPFQQTPHNVPTSNTMTGFAASNNASGGFPFPLSTTTHNTSANTASFSFGGSKPADTSGFSFNIPVSKTTDAFGFPFGGGSQQQTQTFGADPNVTSPIPAFSLGQGGGAGTFQFNANTAVPQQPPGVFNFGTVPPAAGSNFTQFGATSSNSPFNFAPGGGMFSIGAGAANRTRPGAMRRRKPN